MGDNDQDELSNGGESDDSEAPEEQAGDEMVRQTRRSSAPLTYIIIYGRLKRRFHVATYKEIGDDHYAEVVAYLREELRKALNGEQPEQTNLF